MKQNAILVVTSLLSILLLTIHITDDIVRGISQAESSNTALIVLVVLLYGTLVLAERRSGHVIMLLVGLLAAAMPVMHMRGAHYGEIAKSTGGFFSSGHSGRSAGSGASRSSSRCAGCGVCDGDSQDENGEERGPSLTAQRLAMSRASRTSSMFLRRMIGSMFMLVKLELRPPAAPTIRLFTANPAVPCLV
jgi:hypothetical protein